MDSTAEQIRLEDVSQILGEQSDLKLTDNTGSYDAVNFKEKPPQSDWANNNLKASNQTLELGQAQIRYKEDKLSLGQDEINCSKRVIMAQSKSGTVRPISHRPIDEGTVSNLEAADYYGPAYNSGSISIGPSCSRANSEPNLESTRILLKGRLHKLRPKQRGDFLKGCVLRWEDFNETERRLKHKKEKVTVLRSLQQDSDKDKIARKAILKVYSRDKNKKTSKNNLVPEMNHLTMVEINEGPGSDFEGDRQLLFKPESSATSYCSESEGTFISDTATEEDSDLHLQGLSSLMEDYESTGNIHQQNLLHNDISLIHPCTKILPQSVDEGEGGKKSCYPRDMDCMKEKSIIREESNVDWNKVQTLLTEMGLQLIQQPINSILSRKSINTTRNRIPRELQNLEFNVNYDRSDCSRGKKLLP